MQRANGDFECFRHQIVRDLNWVVSSPHLLQPGAGVPLFGDEEAQRLATSAKEWLQTVDADPSHLRKWLLSQAEHYRLGHYFAALVEYWLRFCPAFGGARVATRREFGDGDDDVSNGNSPSEAGGRPSERQLKFLIEGVGGRKPRHFEAAIHFSVAKGLGEVDIIASRFSGAFLHESLCWRVLDAFNRLRFAQQADVASALRDEMGCAPEFGFWLRGYVFYPIEVFAHASCASSATAQLPDGTTEKWRFLSSGHAAGWWATSVDQLQPLLVDTSRWVILAHRRFWLSHLVAFPVGDSKTSPAGLQVQGDDVIGLGSLEVYSPEFLFAEVAAFQQKYARHPVLLAELRSTGDGRWVERSRGFILPKRYVKQSGEAQDSCADRQDDAALEEGDSISKMQMALERMLRSGGGLEQWWKESDKLAQVAKNTTRQSHQAAEKRLAVQWQPPPPVDPLPIAAAGDGQQLAIALELRWSGVCQNGRDADAVADVRCAVVSLLGASPSPADMTLSCLLAWKESDFQRTLGHILLDALRRLQQKRGDGNSGDVDITLGLDARAAFDTLLLSTLRAKGCWCPKVVAKACQAFHIHPPPPGTRQCLLEDLLSYFGHVGYPDKAGLDNACQETLLVGALMLCELRLAGPDAARYGRLLESEAKPLLRWLARVGAANAAQAFLRPGLLGDWQLSAESLFAEDCVAFGRHKLARKLCPGIRPASSGKKMDHKLLKCKLPATVAVRWVDSNLGLVLEDILERASAEGGFVALDAEWQPHKAGDAPTQVEILQIAVPSRVWVLDLPQLMRQDEDVFGTSRLLEQLCSGKFVLVGFGLREDLQRLVRSYEKLSCEFVQRALDLRHAGGLRARVREALGLDLDKGQQCSNWSSRPLDEQQLQYAALDAYVLLWIAARERAAIAQDGNGTAAISDTPRFLQQILCSDFHHPDVQRMPIALPPKRVRDAFLSITSVTAAVAETMRPIECKSLALVYLDPVVEASAVVDCGASRGVLVVLPRTAQLDMARVQAVCGAQKLRMARRDELIPIFGYEPQGIGPLGLREGCDIIVEATLVDRSNQQVIRVGGGAPYLAIDVLVGDVVSSLGATVAHIAAD